MVRRMLVVHDALPALTGTSLRILLAFLHSFLFLPLHPRLCSLVPGLGCSEQQWGPHGLGWLWASHGSSCQMGPGSASGKSPGHVQTLLWVTVGTAQCQQLPMCLW